MNENGCAKEAKNAIIESALNQLNIAVNELEKTVGNIEGIDPSDKKPETPEEVRPIAALIQELPNNLSAATKHVKNLKNRLSDIFL